MYITNVYDVTRGNSECFRNHLSAPTPVTPRTCMDSLIYRPFLLLLLLWVLFRTITVTIQFTYLNKSKYKSHGMRRTSELHLQVSDVILQSRQSCAGINRSVANSDASIPLLLIISEIVRLTLKKNIGHKIYVSLLPKILLKTFLPPLRHVASCSLDARTTTRRSLRSVCCCCLNLK
jgi:hypothetical protein